MNNKEFLIGFSVAKSMVQRDIGGEEFNLIKKNFNWQNQDFSFEHLDIIFGLEKGSIRPKADEILSELKMKDKK